MQTREQLPLVIRRGFLTGRNCLDFTHTGGEGEYAVWEQLHEPEDVAWALGVILGVDGLRVTGSDLPAVRRLRAAITRLARDPERHDADVAVVNAAAARPPLVPRLELGGDAALEPGTAEQALSTLARDAVDLFSSPLAGRIRVCEADDCGLLFVDASRPGRRRWCSMDRCGDRQKKHRTRSRRQT